MEPLRGNESFHKYFILNSFNELGALRLVLFFPFFIMFILSLLANSLLLYVIISQRSLHSPMYILIAGMACVDLSLPLFFVPNMLLNFLFDWRGISLIGSSSLLVWMALDRYFAICTPSHLNVIDHCFCEHMALVELACGSTIVNSLVGLISVFLIPVADFIIIAVSYIIIFSSVLRSGKSRVKALHTCVTHIVVNTVSLSIILIAFLSYRIRNGLPAAIRVFISIMYLFFPSCFNPIIYGMRTAEIRQHIVKMLSWCNFVQTGPNSLQNY
uniref:Olfactory receptor n=1 Tax=Labrus bergylta TaxID=56723 RepID=A0A3Q3EDV4_9LABR